MCQFMDFRFSFEGRTERLIGTGRLVLASFSLLGIWLDPTTPSKYAFVAYPLLISYVLYAAVVTLVVWASHVPLVRLRIVTHIVDVVMFSLFVYFIEGPTSPFFAYFVFAIVCATLRWQWRGALWTAVAVLAAFLGIGFYASEILQDQPTFELDRFIIRSVYLAVVAALLGYLGVHESQRRIQLSNLAAWPRTPLLEFEKAVSQILEQAGNILEAPRVLLAWEESEEPWLHLVMFSGGQLQWSRKPSGIFNPMVAASLDGNSFFCQDVRTSTAVVVYVNSAEVRRWHGEPLNHEMKKLFNIRSVLCVTVLGENLKGRLFFLDKSFLTSDDVVLADVVASQVAMSMDLFYYVQGLQRLAATEERIRLAGDIHDGVLQSLTAAGFQLQATLQVLDENPQAAREHLRAIQDLIVQEQRDLRALVEEAKLARMVPSETDCRLVDLLERLARTVEQQWSLRVELKMVGSDKNVSATLRREIYRIVRESLINATRHSQGSMARVEVEFENHHVHISVSDNGCGFPFRGHYDQAALTTMGLGPTMLKNRIAFLGGSLSIHSADSGARLEITLPLSHGEN